MCDKYTGALFILENRRDVAHEGLFRVRVERRCLVDVVSVSPSQPARAVVQAANGVLTASSKNSIGGSFRSTLDMANRCFSPPVHGHQLAGLDESKERGGEGAKSEE